MSARRKKQREQPERVISDREARRFVRAEVAMVKWKRLRHRWAVEECAGRAGVNPRTWRNVEHGRHSPTALTLTRMKAGVFFTVGEMLAVLERRKIQHLRRIGRWKNSSNSQG